MLQRWAWIVKFEVFFLLSPLGVRDRLRCPICHKIGTWKPHEGPRRWLCKWCGYYEDVERWAYARPCAKKRVWMIRPLAPQKTAAERIKNQDPWRG